jgi:hypothetical protein
VAIEEDLSLNIEDALAAIDKMADGLQNALTAFFAAFNDAVQQLGQAAIPLQFQTEIEGGVQGAFQENQDVTIQAGDGDATGAASAIEGDLSDIQGDAVLTVDGEDVGLSSTVQEGLDPGDPPEVVFDVNADTSEAQSNVSDLEQGVQAVDSSLQDAASSSENLAQSSDVAASSMENVAAKTDEAAEGTKKLANENEKAAESAEKLSDQTEAVAAAAVFAAKGVASVLAAALATATGLFTAAVKAESALVGFNQQLGSMAAQVSKIDAAGLNIELAQLAQNLGSDDEAALQASQRFALLGQTSGATADEIAKANSNLFAIAANIRSVNPSVGELGQIAGTLSNALAQGGRAAQRFGLNLSATEIRLKASEMTGKSVTSQFSRFELAAAGAALGVEQFGDSIQRNVEDALKNPEIALSRFRQIFSDTLEELGKPFIVPFLELIELGLPVILKATEIFSTLANAAIPGVQAAADAAVGPVMNLLETLLAAAAGFSESFDAIGFAFAEAVEAAEPFLLVIGELISYFATGLADVLTVVAGLLGGLIDVFGETAIVIYAVYRAAKTLDAFLLAAPGLGTWTRILGLLAAGIVTLIGVVNQSPEPLKGFESSLADAEKQTLLVADSVDFLNGELEEFIKQKEVLSDNDLVAALSEIGITVDDFTSMINGGTEGLREFMMVTAAMNVQDWAYYTVGGERVELTAEKISELSEAQLLSAFRTRNTSGAMNLLADDLDRLQKSTEETKRRELERTIALNGLTSAQRDQLYSMATNAAGVVDYDLALRVAADTIRKKNQEEEARRITSGEAAEAERNLAEETRRFALLLAEGTISLEDYTYALHTTSLDAEEAEGIIRSLAEAMNEFVDGAVERVPSVAEAFADLGPEKTAQSLIDSFQTQIDATNRWNEEMVRLRSEGQSNILRVVAELGPEQGLLLLSQYANNEKQLEEHLANMAAAEFLSAMATRQVAVENWLFLQGITGDGAQAVVDELRQTLALGPATEENILEAIDAVRENSPEYAAEFENMSESATDALTVGSAEELRAKAEELNGAIRATWEGAGGVAEAASAVAAQAGVQKFNSIVSSGFLDGPTVQTILVRTSTFFSTSGLSVGTAFGESIRMGFLMQVPSITNAIINSLNTSSQAAFTTAKRLGWQIGEKLIEGIVDHIRIAGAFGSVTSEIRSLLDIAGSNGAAYANIVGINIGSSMVNGLVNTIRSGSTAVSSAARQIIANAEAAAKAEAESDSPSKVWERLGRDLVSGLSKGLSDSSRIAESAASGVIGKTNEQGIGSGGTSISISVPVTVSSGMTGQDGRLIGSEVGRAVSAEIMSRLRMEARVS